MNMNIIDYWV